MKLSSDSHIMLWYIILWIWCNFAFVCISLREGLSSYSRPFSRSAFSHHFLKVGDFELLGLCRCCYSTVYTMILYGRKGREAADTELLSGSSLVWRLRGRPARQFWEVWLAANHGCETTVGRTPYTPCQKRSKFWCWLLRTMVCNSRLPNSPVVVTNHGSPSQNRHAKQPLTGLDILLFCDGGCFWLLTTYVL